MKNRVKTIFIIASSTETGLIEPRSMTETRFSPTVLVCAGLTPGLRTRLITHLDLHPPDAVIDTEESTGLLARRTRRRAIDVDAVAPRLRSVHLPVIVADAGTVVAAVDVRRSTGPRPDLILGLWTRLVSPRQRLAARLTGPRDGLTAELLLARRPDHMIVADVARRGGPLIAVSGTDPIAVEVMTLALRDVRSSSAPTGPGPWEDPLVQRATELDLGIRGPGEASIIASIGDDLAPADQTPLHQLITRAAARAGIDSLVWSDS